MCVALAVRRRGGGCEGLALDVSGSAGGGVNASVNVTICRCNIIYNILSSLVPERYLSEGFRLE